MIRKAEVYESGQLTKIAFDSKALWKYPDEYFRVWKDELTITADYIKDNVVFVYENNNNVIAFYSLIYISRFQLFPGIKLERGYWLDHMFVFPDYIKQGIGMAMFNHMYNYCRENGIKKIRLLSDPNTRGFYEKCGCKYIKEYPSSIINRKTPLMEINIV